MKYWFYFLTIILLISCIYVTYEKIESDKMVTVLLDMTKNNTDKLSKLKVFQENRLHELTLNGTIISRNSDLIDASGAICKLNDLLNGNKLILRYSHLNCNICIEEQIKNLNAYADFIGVENILLFTTYDNYFYMDRFRKANKIQFSVYNMKDELNKIFEDIGLPYFFILTKKADRINNMFIPLKEAPTITDRYLNLVCEKYFRMKEYGK